VRALSSGAKHGLGAHATRRAPSTRDAPPSSSSCSGPPLSPPLCACRRSGAGSPGPPREARKYPGSRNADGQGQGGALFRAPARHRCGRGGSAGLKQSGVPVADYPVTEEVSRPIPRPPGVTPCVVTLIKEQNFSYFEAKANFAYAPPAPARACGSTWQLVVLSVSAHITGRQFDRRMLCSSRTSPSLWPPPLSPGKDMAHRHCMY